MTQASRLQKKSYDETQTTMKAIVFQSKDQPLQIKEMQKPVPGKGELLIRLHYAALNHLDLWIWKEEILEKPVIPGSDGSGVVVDGGEGVDRGWVGKEVIINPSLYWGDNENVYSDKYEILGNPANGTFAEYITISLDCVHEKPSHLSLKQAAAVPLAALTAYRALFTKAQLKSSDTVLVTGIGGGAALYLLQMAAAAGASVYVTSSSEEKMEKAMQLGAKGAYNYKDENWVMEAKAEQGGFDVIVDSAGGNGFAQLTEAANAGARMVLFGRTAGNINNLRPGLIYNKQLQIMGTVMGTPAEFKAMLEFYSRHKLYPVLDKEFSLENIQEAADYMKTGHHFGKIILKINDQLQN
jgi:NADPH:quinone reductase-like Zn-dependent oxidoreductase